jgi:predicted ATPase
VQEQQIFRRLSSFVGGCTLEAIEAICIALSHEEKLPLLNGIASLIDQSLLYQVEQDTHEPRLFMLETIRAYGLECLAINGETTLIQQAHAVYYLALAEEAEPGLTGTEQHHWLARLELEHDNLRATLY